MVEQSRVLVVDDNEGVRTVVTEFLGLSGYATTAAENGAVGLEVARAWHPAVIVIDLMMPVMDGWTFREEQVADPALQGIPVVVITASYTADADLARLDGLRVLRKPLDFEALLAAVADACGVPT